MSIAQWSLLTAKFGIFYSIKLNNIGSIRSLYSFSLFLFRSEKLLPAVAESTSAITLLEPNVSSPKELLGTTSSEGWITDNPQPAQHNTTDSSPPSASSLVSKILARYPRNWYQVFYIRMDRGGYFCMYPNLGGPFRSIYEADDAIERYLDELRHKAM